MKKIFLLAAFLAFAPLWSLGKSSSDARLFKAQPAMRVGLFVTETKMKVSASVPYRVEDQNGAVLKTRDAGKSATIKLGPIKKGNYRRVVPETDGIITLLNYENRPEWNTDLNDNMFRGIIEIRQGDSENVWVINELPLEQYLSGIAEAGNENDADYLRALMVAARTYAVYNILTPTKHSGEHFILDTSSNDQVYRGYGAEMRLEKITQAVLDTAKKIAFYGGEIALTPYFSQSDGRTRAWSEVWNGEKPWLVSKEDPCCTENTLLGHGVGMSALGARYFAEEKDWSWKKILKYYYTGIRIQEAYE